MMGVVKKLLVLKNNMDTKAIVKGSLATISMTLIGAGASMLMAKDLFGFVLVVVGVGLNFYKEFYNRKVK